MEIHVAWTETEALCGAEIDPGVASYGGSSCVRCNAILDDNKAITVHELERVFLADNEEGKLYLIYRRKTVGG